MADNVTITPGIGKAIRTDEVSGTHLQVVKLALGADGSEDALLSSGAPMPATLRDGVTGLAATVQAVQQTPGGNALRVQIGPGDVISNIPVVIEYDHHQIHEGEVYQYFWQGALNSASKDFRIVVPDVLPTLRTPHIVAEVISDATITNLYWYEGTTWNSSGQDDSARIYNRNRNVTEAAGTKIYVSGTPALTPNALGTNFWQGLLFSSAKSSLSMESRAMSEWDLRANTEYLFRITTTSSANVLMRLSFYEDLGV